MNYKQLSRLADAMGETNDCAVKAVTVVSGRPYEEVHREFRRHGRKVGRRTPREITKKVLAGLGIRTVDVTATFGAKTVRTLQRKLVGRKGRYLVWVRGHVLGVLDGQVCDWTNGRLHRIQKVERIL